MLDRLFGIPHLVPEAAALFRIAIGGALVWLLWNHAGFDPVGDTVFRDPGSGYGTGKLAVAHWLRANVNAQRIVYWAALISAATFAVGLLTRISAVVLWTSVFLLISVRLVTAGQHNWGAPLLALAGLMFSPLGDAWSVDARLRRAARGSPPAEASAVYGFAAWWIGFVLGVAFLAAAYAKLKSSGFAWITTGAVGFHFLEDANNAIVPWGIWIAGRPWLTVLLSAIAIFVEAALIIVIFCRGERLRLAFGAMGLSLQVGIYLFQGVLWWPWIVLYLAFLPWQSLAGWLTRPIRSSSTGPRRLPRLSGVHVTAVVLLLASQVYASARRIEHEPLLSNYPMYSGTSPSREVFLASLQWSKLLRYGYAWIDAAGTPVPIAPRDGIIGANDESKIVDAVRTLCTGTGPPPPLDTWAVIQRRLTDHTGRPTDRLAIIVDIREIDFDGMRIVTRVTGLHALTINLQTATLDYVAPGFDPPCTRNVRR